MCADVLEASAPPVSLRENPIRDKNIKMDTRLKIAGMTAEVRLPCFARNDGIKGYEFSNSSFYFSQWLCVEPALV